MMDAEDIALSLVEAGALRVEPTGAIVRVAIVSGSCLRMLRVARVCKPSPGNGYVHVVVRAVDGRRHVVKGHRLVWRAFRAPMPHYRRPFGVGVVLLPCSARASECSLSSRHTQNTLGGISPSRWPAHSSAGALPPLALGNATGRLEPS